ncbi:uncharacterized protein LOC143424030 [Xylocopa sonorina]|uniref:uncharacterized protein LOC143424030 n=1 Tax=Xylocopa sonorina TaxID=1818115 RepID=UPI00403A9043
MLCNEMNSSKSGRKSSRRSSILKPPKPRQVLQELNFSSNENTSAITTKIKRRVSFAEKKHVKEFCNSLDQGTVWNNTYEEHDISNLKVLGISTQEESEIQSVSIQQNAIQFVCNEPTEEEVNTKDCKSHIINVAEGINYQDEMQLTAVSLALHNQNDKENTVTCLSELQFENNSHISKSITVYEGTDEKLQEKLLKPNAHNFIYKNLNATTLEETCMDFTQIIPDNMCSEADRIQNTKVENIVNNESMELTETILPSINVQNFQQFDKSTKVVTDTVDQNVSMEFNAVCIGKPVDNVNNVETLMTLESDDSKTKKLDNISMEMTAAVCHLQTNDNGRNYCTLNRNDMFVSRHITATATSSSLDSVMIPHKENNNAHNSSEYFSKSTKALTDTVDQNMSMEFTAACIAKPVDNVNNAGILMTLGSDDTEIKKLDNISMEMTAAVCHLQTNDNGRIHCTSNKNDMFVSKDITATATSSSLDSVTIPDKENSNAHNSSEYFSKSTKPLTDTVDQNMSMEFTAACIAKPVDNVNNVGMLMTLESDDTKTKELDNISMEMTAAVCHLQTNDNGRSHCTSNKNDMFVSKDITATANFSSLDSVTIPDKENSNAHNSSEYFSKSTKPLTDTVDQNVSMEFNAVCIGKPVDNVNNVETLMTLESDDSKTKKLDNISMEITAAVCHLQTNDNGRNYCTLNRNDMFVSRHITATATSSSLDSVMIPHKENNNAHNSSEYFSKSTKALTDTVDQNMSMEFTAACIAKPVDNVNNAGILMTLGSDDTEIKKLDNISMEMTAAVCHLQTNDNGRIHCTSNKNDMFVSKDITATATSSSLDSVTIPDKENSNAHNSSEYFSKSTKPLTDTVDQNMSMEFTAACIAKPVDNVNNVGMLMTLESDDTKTKELDNISMEMTAAVCHLQTNDNGRSHCTSNKNDMFVSKDITATATSSSLDSVTIPDKENSNAHNSSEYFSKSTKPLTDTVDQNVSMEFTAACIAKPVDNVNNAGILMTLGSDDTETKKLNNISMEMTAATYHLQTNDNGRTSSLQNVNNLQMQDDQDVFFNYGLEELDSIKPPSFIDLDDLSIMHTSVNVDYNQKINTTSCFSRNENSECKYSLEFKDQQINIPEKMCKLQTSVIKYMSINDTLTSSILEQEDQVQADKIQELDVKNANMDIQVLECSAVNDNGMSFMMSDSEKGFRNLYSKNFNSKENVMKCSSANIIPQIKLNKNIDKLSNTQVVKVDAEHSKSHVTCEEQSIVNKLKICAKSDDIIWQVYREDIERNIFAIGFISCSLLVVIFLQDSCDITGNEYIKKIKIVSRLADDADVLISIVHHIILDKLDVNELMNLYKKCEDILPMLDYISKEVKLAMDFMFDLKRLSDINLMEITRDSVSFISRTKKRDIILRVTVNIKPFDKIKSQDVSVHCLLGSIREEIVKKLITNIKRDHKFLRRYINDVRDYISVMEETGNVI